MLKPNNPLAAVLFLVVMLLGSWFVIKRGMSMRQQKDLAKATAVYTPPLAEPMAHTALPERFAFEALPKRLRWRRLVGEAKPGAAPSLLCFWADFSPEDYALLQKPWGLGEGGRQGLFVDGFLPAWFLEALCEEGLLCPGKERAAALRPPEVFLAPRGRHLLYTAPRLRALFGCIEEGG
jgi:hypothetical protein